MGSIIVNFSNFKAEPRDAQYARYALGMLAMLREAVDRRVLEGMSKAEIAQKIGRDKSSLTRVLNGRVRNLTIKTISDILWATDHDPEDPKADAVEDIVPNFRPKHLCLSVPVGSLVADQSHSMKFVERAEATKTVPAFVQRLELVE